MIMEEQSKESSLQSVAIRRNVYVPHVQENIKANGSSDSRHINQSDSHFIAKVSSLLFENFNTPLGFFAPKEK